MSTRQRFDRNAWRLFKGIRAGFCGIGGRCRIGAGWNRRDWRGCVRRGCRRGLVNGEGGFRRWKHHKPPKNHYETENRRYNEILVLIVHMTAT